MITAVAAGQGIAPLFIDLNRTHATNPLWPGHARFHVVWQTFELTLASILEVAMIWWPSPFSHQLFYLAAFFTSVPMAGFVCAMVTRKMYAGTLRDPNGIKPVRVRLGTTTKELDMNAVLVFVGAGVLTCAVLIFGGVE